MAIIGIIGGAAASGGRTTNAAPVLTYNSFPGVFNIVGADATANYSSYSTISSGSLSFGTNNATVTLTSASSSGTIANRTVKGVTTSPSTPIGREPFSYTYVAGAGNTGPCYPYTPAGGTRYGGQWMAFNGGPYTYLNPVPGYTQAPSEWYKVT